MKVILIVSSFTMLICYLKMIEIFIHVRSNPGIWVLLLTFLNISKHSLQLQVFFDYYFEIIIIYSFLYRLPYPAIFGGVSAITKDHFELLNGFSNSFWGWGGEDDDMSNRIRNHHLHISRYPLTIARYTMLIHKKDKPNPNR